MNPKIFQNKYRVQSTRLQNWDYGWNGKYFITICTRKREHFFGKIKNGEMLLSESGKLAERYWRKIPDHFTFITLGAFVIMPNHMHGIIIIDKPDDNDENKNSRDKQNIVETPKLIETPKLGVSTDNGLKNNIFKNTERKWKPGTLGVVINHYKRICTLRIRKINPDFGWQYRFYDHIIRNAQSHAIISYYITHNPENWNKDEFK